MFRYQPDNLKTRLRRSTRSPKEKPRHDGGILSESFRRLVGLVTARCRESSKAEPKKRQRGGLCNETNRIAVYREGVCALAMAKRVRDQFKS